MVVIKTRMAATVAMVPFLIRVLDTVVEAPAEAAMVASLLSFSVKFVLNMDILLMFVISGLMLAFTHMIL